MCIRSRLYPVTTARYDSKVFLVSDTSKAWAWGPVIGRNHQRRGDPHSIRATVCGQRIGDHGMNDIAANCPRFSETV